MSNLFVRTALVLGLCCGSARAMTEPESRSVTVRFDDLNLATTAGEHTLRNRIAGAVTLVCGDVDARDLAQNALIRACRASAMKNATPQIELATANAHGPS